MKKVLAFDIGGTNTRVALINENFEIEKVEIRPTVRDSIDGFLENVDKIIDLFDLSDVIAFGAGIPGLVNRETGYIYEMSNVHIDDIPFGEHMMKKYGKKSYLRNDAEVACLAEACIGSGKEYERVFFITISTGLGGALVVDQENQDYVTEIGHTAYTYKGDLDEYEHFASGQGIVKLAKANGINIASSREFFDLIRNKDPKALIAKEEWLNVLTDFINLIQNSYSPDIICVTGGVTKAKDLFFKELQDKNPNSNIVECFFKEEAGLIGAATYAFKKEEII